MTGFIPPANRIVQHGSHHPLDGSMILFDDVVEVFDPGISMAAPVSALWLSIAAVLAPLLESIRMSGVFMLPRLERSRPCNVTSSARRTGSRPTINYAAIALVGGNKGTGRARV
jgi:hypothetical protein